MNDSLDDVLSRYFDDVARHDHLGDTPVRVVMRRGRRRRARRRTGAMASTLVVGALGSVAAVRTLPGGDGNRRPVSVGNGGADGSSDDTPAPIPTVGDVQLAPSPLVWNDVTVGSTEAIAVSPFQVVADSAGGFYALSTEPGRNDGTTSDTKLYHSTDGTRWEMTGGQPAISSRSDLAASSGRLYAVGTVAATAPVAQTFDPGAVVLAQSADGGASWNNQPLPLDLGAVRTLPDVSGVTVNGSVGANDAGAVVAAVSRATLDTAGLTPAGVDADSLDWWTDSSGPIERELVPCALGEASASTAPGQVTETTSMATGTGATADGTTTPPVARGSGGCTEYGPEVRRYSWNELGVPAETLRASRGAVHVLFAADGAAFVEQTVPPTPDGWTVASTRTVVTETQYMVLVDLFRPTTDGNGESRTIAYLSGDGASWTTSELPAGLGSGSAGVLADGSIAVAGYGDRGQGAVAVLHDGVWESTSFSAFDLGEDVLTSMSLQPSIGPLGVAAIAYVGRPAEASPAATTVPASSSPMGVAPPTTVSGMIALDGSGRVVEGSSVRPVLLFSADGVTWSSTELDELRNGIEGSFGNLTITDRAIVLQHLSTADVSADANAPLPDQTVFVGTLD